MHIDSIAQNYATSFMKFLVRREKSQEDIKGIIENIKILYHDVILNDRTIYIFFISPSVPNNMKSNILKTIFQNQISNELLKFLLTIIENGRIVILDKIYESLLSCYRDYYGEFLAEITLQRKFETQYHKEIEREIKGSLQKNYAQFGIKNKSFHVELKYKYDPSILGGSIIRIKDYFFDFSVSSQLKKMLQKK